MSSNVRRTAAPPIAPAGTPAEYSEMEARALLAEEPPKPPMARVEPRAHTLHGETRIDHYFWLRDRNDPEVTAYLEAENRYTGAVMRHTEELQEVLYQEM